MLVTEAREVKRLVEDLDENEGLTSKARKLNKEGKLDELAELCLQLIDYRKRVIEDKIRNFEIG